MPVLTPTEPTRTQTSTGYMCARCGTSARTSADGLPAGWSSVAFSGRSARPVCGACMELRKPCHRCDVITFNEATAGIDHSCASCVQDKFLSARVNEYSYKPNMYFLHPDRRTTKARASEKYFGIEVEAEVKNFRPGEMVNKFLSHTYKRGLSFWATRDGSLCDPATGRDAGAEFKTHPLTMAYLRKNIKPHATLTALRKCGAQAYKSGRCGLHVHVSTPYFTTDTNAFHNRKKVRIFVSKCMTPIKKFSCRHGRGDNYAKYEEAGEVRRTSYESSHCYAVNTEHGNKTIEFRMFRGTLDQARFTASIQFCDAVTDFCQLHGHGYIYNQSGRILWSDFIRFIRARAKWGKLYAQLRKQGINH